MNYPKHTFLNIHEDEKIIASLKKGVWLYFILLIFEGGLRKWVLPGLADPLLIIRDPVALWLILKAWHHGYFRLNTYIILAWSISFVAFYTTLFFGHGNWMVAIYGLRILTLHFSLIFIIGNVFSLSDAKKIGEVLLWINIGMTILVAIQFSSPQSAWVNRGVGDDTDGSGFGGVGEYLRVPGTFSFTSGLAFFYGLVAAYIFYFWIEKKAVISKWLLVISTISLLAAVPLSISRTVLFELLLSGIFAIIVSGKSPKLLFRVMVAIVLGLSVFWMLGNTTFFQTAIAAFTERFESANRSEGGVEGVFLDRFLGGMLSAITSDNNFDFWGKGLGIGTNAGAKLMTGRATFLVAEGEWGRLIGEMGMVLGFIAILLRLGLTINLFRLSWLQIGKDNYLPWLLFSFAAIVLLQGNWAQPTTMGFGVLPGGLILASLRSEE